ncbi:hypothetical protein KFV02_04445 [Desulfohalobiaceae bacterium Ax17]|uniref:TrlF family AAA-like ATPase n=1 Tax=Desulfovulcanus ferrireducens TaxID=2831190 RepID=UPI00207BB1E6|nr:AAA family ATPase [Desulfovulcanus ferrireducens]MBT8763177.1 hypothetical protein [Desulfovulcanus ferrireducens]
MIEGSNWHKWDLHIHTPSSIIQDYGGDNDETWEKFILALERLPEEVKVVGITDYYFIDGYEKVMSYKYNGRLKNLEKIFPILEFRIDTFGSGNENKLQKINLHILFDVDETNLQAEINKIREEFIKQIPLTKLSQHKTKNLSKENLTNEGGDLKTGFSDLIPSTDRVFELLESETWKNKTFLFLGYKEWSNLEKNNQLKPLKEHLYDKVNTFFSSNFATFEKNQEWLNEFGNKKLLHSQDIHDFKILDTANKNEDDIFIESKNYNCFTWIKAEPTFEGLKQIKYEPDDRVFIGEKPELLERVSYNKTKFIKKLSINQIDGYSGKKGVWFNNIIIPFNYGMVSIIGNKGSGKSAIADIIGLCSNSHHYKDFSFLNRDRFLKGGLAKNFTAKLEFASGKILEKNLSENIDINSPERVRYLPQSFFERLTNDLESYDFERTLEELVFSYLPEEEKLGESTFQDLIAYKKESIKKDIELIEKEIKEINEELIKLEEKANSNYFSKLKNELVIKKNELEELEKNKPIEVKNPDSDEETKEKNEKITKELEGLNKKKEKLEELLEKSKNELINLKREIEELKTVKEDLLRFENEIKEIISLTSQKLEKYDIDSTKILSYKLDLTDLNKLLEKKKRKYKETAQTLYSEENIADVPENKQKIIKTNSIVIKLHNINTKIKELKNKLSTPYKKYHEYLENLKKWEKDKNVIIGDIEKTGTIKWYENQIKNVTEELPTIIIEKRDLRVNKTLLILDKKLEIVKIYNRLKESVDNEIKGHKDILKDYEINIDVALKLKPSFSNDFLSFINKGVKGSFYEIEQSNERIKKLIENKNFQEKDILKQFLDEIIQNLEIDKREGYNNEKRQIKEQIIQGKVFDFYNFLFSINYLEPSYELKLGEKHITELSPGEKGAMLIVFYLMLDKENIPLIIDQPEENLDNESIYKILVHFIKETKKRRQVIMVTHNPNLAIVGDSEQIIYVSIDKKNKNTFSFSSGAIENPEINELSSKILEGTIKAFDIRRLKYFEV